jgi:FdhD protein
MAAPVREVAVVRFPAGASTDDVVVEEPLEIRISSETLAITMRTPGHDRELVLGFLLGEGIIRSVADVASVVHCGRIGDEGRENTINVTLTGGVRPPIDEDTGLLTRRGTIVTSACGVCGRRSIDDLLARMANGPVDAARPAPRFPRSGLVDAVAGLAAEQPIFGRTGGCHAAALYRMGSGSGIQRLHTREDIGRHNAVDKVIGAELLAGSVAQPPNVGEDGTPAASSRADHLLVVSGRASFEIVQKAFAAGIGAIAAVSAPSALAVDLAARTGILLAAFVRKGGMTIYASADRFDAEA